MGSLNLRRTFSSLLLVSLLSAGALPASLRSQLAEQTKSALNVSTALGVHVVDIATGEMIYGFNEDRQRIIASNTKLFTTAAALELLGPGYFIETGVMIRGQQAGETLNGDLAVLGGGDPNISGRLYDGDPLAVFRGWARKAKELGIHQITGDVHLIDGLFDPPRVHPDWPEDQLSRWYEAPIDALSFSDNCIMVRVHPNSKPGEPARVESIPELGLFRVENRARVTAHRSKHRVIIERTPGTNHVVVSGWVYQKAAPVESWVTVLDPVEYFGAALLKAFADERVQIDGKMYRKPRLAGAGWRDLTVHRTDLLTTLEVVNKRSQNFYAEVVMKLIGAIQCGEGSWSAGRRAVEEFLDTVGLKKGTYALADGSGMSRNNRFYPSHLTALLGYMFYHPLGPEFIFTLPFSGEEGLSWEKRLAGDPYEGNVFAKTGSLRGVSTLSGYAKGRSGKIYAFSILHNSVRNSWRAKRAQDQIVKTLVDNG
jgi:D-alanyl-D-alanine carboxypeptidase/D-alanyl-D-alanine-endopeptidase (penicillin-binding protein 4)